MSALIQDLLRDKPPVMVLDMGLGSRLQGFPVRDREPVELVAGLVAADPIVPDADRPRG